jgi:hypothetical protein
MIPRAARHTPETLYKPRSSASGAWYQGSCFCVGASGDRTRRGFAVLASFRIQIEAVSRILEATNFLSRPHVIPLMPGSPRWPCHLVHRSSRGRVRLGDSVFSWLVELPTDEFPVSWTSISAEPTGGRDTASYVFKPASSEAASVGVA